MGGAELRFKRRVGKRTKSLYGILPRRQLFKPNPSARGVSHPRYDAIIAASLQPGLSFCPILLMESEGRGECKGRARFSIAKLALDTGFATVCHETPLPLAPLYLRVDVTRFNCRPRKAIGGEAVSQS